MVPDNRRHGQLQGENQLAGPQSLKGQLTCSVVATSKDTYSLKYFKVDQDEAEDDE